MHIVRKRTYAGKLLHRRNDLTLRSFHVTSKIAWPELVKQEYAYFKKNSRCSKAKEFNRVFNLDDSLISDYLPCFFAGKVGKSPFVLLSLNPGYKKIRKDVECEKCTKLGWEKTYLTFFEWFSEKNIPSPYYSRFAVFLSGLVGEERIPEDRAHRFQLLANHLVNLDLIPYHSERINLNIKKDDDEQISLIKPYLLNLVQLVKLCNPKIVFLNGAPFKPIIQNDTIIEEMRFIERKPHVKVNARLTARIGKCFNKDAVWFDKFMICQKAHPTNEELHKAGKEIRKRFSL